MQEDAGGTAPAWTLSERKRLVDRVAELNGPAHEQILRIVNSSGIKYTYNKNGVFCDITKIPVEALEEISKFVDFIKASEERNPPPLLLPRTHSDYASGPPPEAAEIPADVVKESMSNAAAYSASKIRAFTSSVLKTKSDTASQKRREANRYNQARKKFLRECTCKTTFPHELQPE